MRMLTIRFEGLCCHTSRANGESFKKRTIVPTAADHISYIEFFADDFDPEQNAGLATKAYRRDNVRYKRIELQDVSLEVKNATLGDITETGTYHQRIPKLTALADGFALRESLRAPQPRSTDAAMFFDMPGGILSGGPPEAFVTQFKPESAWTTRRLAEWAQLDVEITDAPPEIEITHLADGTKQTLKLSGATDMITIGNQTEDDILGMDPPPGGHGHFAVYYDMAQTPPANPPLPEMAMGLGTGCSNTNWP